MKTRTRKKKRKDERRERIERKGRRNDNPTNIRENEPKDWNREVDLKKDRRKKRKKERKTRKRKHTNNDELQEHDKKKNLKHTHTHTYTQRMSKKNAAQISITLMLKRNQLKRVSVCGLVLAAQVYRNVEYVTPSSSGEEMKAGKQEGKSAARDCEIRKSRISTARKQTWLALQI